jgi:hemerythrin-like domain-containing protein
MAETHRETATESHFESPTITLKHEHRVIERALRVLDTLVENPEKGSPEQWGKIIDFIRNFADRCHHLKEEKVLFPALEKWGMDPTAGPISIMLEEHEEGRRHVRAMAESLGTQGARAALVENAKSYLRLLRDHIQKEDEVLFEMADSVLPPEEQRRLVREFEEHETSEMGPGAHEKYVTLLEELEGSVKGSLA